MSTAKVKLKLHRFTPSMILLILSIYILPAQAFFRHLCFGELGNGRVDPIMSPGKASQHLHISFGASSKSIVQNPGRQRNPVANCPADFGFDATTADLMASNCTSCSILQDHSVYWAPRMYFQHSNGTFEMVPTSGGLTA